MPPFLFSTSLRVVEIFFSQGLVVSSMAIGVVQINNYRRCACGHSGLAVLISSTRTVVKVLGFVFVTHVKNCDWYGGELNSTRKVGLLGALPQLTSTENTKVF
jgi:hypothetical protein